jgi:hypothetical protein
MKARMFVKKHTGKSIVRITMRRRSYFIDDMLINSCNMHPMIDA